MTIDNIMDKYITEALAPLPELDKITKKYTHGIVDYHVSKDGATISFSDVTAMQQMRSEIEKHPKFSVLTNNRAKYITLNVLVKR